MKFLYIIYGVMKFLHIVFYVLCSVLCALCSVCACACACACACVCVLYTGDHSAAYAGRSDAELSSESEHSVAACGYDALYYRDYVAKDGTMHLNVPSARVSVHYLLENSNKSQFEYLNVSQRSRVLRQVLPYILCTRSDYLYR